MMNSDYNGLFSNKETRDLGTSLAAITDVLSSRCMIHSVHVCNKTGGAITFDLCKSSGANNTYFYKGYSIAANTSLLFKDHNISLRAGDTLKALASASSSLDVSVSFVQGAN